MQQTDMATPYYDHAAEGEVVAILLNSPETQQRLKDLPPQLFHDMRAQRAISAMHQLRAQHRPIDLVTLRDQLARQNDDTVMDYALEATTGQWTSGALIGQYIDIIKQRALRRELVMISREMAAGAGDATREADELLATARTRLQELALAQGNETQRDGSASAVAVRAFAALQEQATGTTRPAMLGLSGLDAGTGGLYPGEMLVIGARPGTGKTALALDFARRLMEQGMSCLFASLEMSDIRLMYRIMAADSGVNGMKMRRAELTGDDWERLGHSMERISALPLWITRQVRTVSDLRDEIVAARERMGHVDVVIADYIQLMRVPGKIENRTQEVSKISRELKLLAEEQRVVMIVLSQLNREGVGRPSISQLRDSGQIEQDADMIMLLYAPTSPEDVRPAYLGEIYADVSARGNRYIECILAKARDGEPGATPLEFVPSVMQYLPITITREGA